MADSVAEDLELREQIRRLSDEQERLRREQEELKRQTAAKQDGAGNAQGGSKPEEQKPGEGQPDAKQADAKQPDANQPADDKDDKKDDPKKKEEAKQKRANWVREHPITLVVLVIVLIVAAIGGFLLMQYLGSYVSTDDAQVDGHINAVTSRISGTVVGVYAEDNQTVKAGQTLVDIDPRDFKVSVEQAEAQLKQAQAGVEAQNPNVPITQTSRETDVTTSSKDVATALAALSGARQNYQAAIAQLRQAEANYENASSDEVRYKLLVDKEEVSKEQYQGKLTAKIAQKAVVDAQQASADAAKDTIAQREAALSQARDREREAKINAPRQVAIQKAQVASREATTQQNKAQVDQALLNLSYAKIGAPIAGVVGRRSVEVGQQVSPGQQLMGITNLEDLWVTANFKETQLRNIKPGQSVRIHVDSFGGDFDGFVDSMPGASGAKYSLLPPENATGNYVKVVQRLPVRLRFKSEQNGLERLRPGMSVTPKVYIR